MAPPATVPTATSPVISFVIPVRNDAKRLRSCLDSIAVSDSSGQVQVIVADNGSVDGSPDVARSAGATVLTVPNVSVAELRNIAAGHSQSALLAFVDADHIIDPGWVPAALEILPDLTIGAAGAPCVPPPYGNWVQRAYGRLRPRLTAQQPVEWLGSGNMVVRREAFNQVDGFDASLETCEDVDLCNRLRAAGYRLVGDPRFRNVHLGDPATLRGLIYGELWRGRDNLKVTLRGPITLRALPSLLIPIVHLVCFALLIASPVLGGRVAVGAGLTIVALIALRAGRMTAGKGPLAASDVLANIVVAAAYDCARALSLVFRATHKTRKQAPEDQAVA